MPRKVVIALTERPLQIMTKFNSYLYLFFYVGSFSLAHQQFNIAYLLPGTLDVLITYYISVCYQLQRGSLSQVLYYRQSALTRLPPLISSSRAGQRQVSILLSKIYWRSQLKFLRSKDPVREKFKMARHTENKALEM